MKRKKGGINSYFLVSSVNVKLSAVGSDIWVSTYTYASYLIESTQCERVQPYEFSLCGEFLRCAECICWREWTRSFDKQRWRQQQQHYMVILCWIDSKITCTGHKKGVNARYTYFFCHSACNITAQNFLQQIIWESVCVSVVIWCRTSVRINSDLT